MNILKRITLEQKLKLNNFVIEFNNGKLVSHAAINLYIPLEKIDLLPLGDLMTLNTSRIVKIFNFLVDDAYKLDDTFTLDNTSVNYKNNTMKLSYKEKRDYDQKDFIKTIEAIDTRISMPLITDSRNRNRISAQDTTWRLSTVSDNAFITSSDRDANTHNTLF